MTQPSSDALERAEELLRSGYKTDARSLLIDYLDQHPDSAKGWWLISYAVNDPTQQAESLEKVLKLQPNHRKAQARLAALKGKRPSAKNPFAKLTQIQLSQPVMALILVLGGIALLVVGYLGYRLVFPARTAIPTQAEIAQILETSSTAVEDMESAQAGTPSPPSTATQTPVAEATNTPLVSTTPTADPNATRTPISENMIGTAAGLYPPDFTLTNAVTNAEVNIRDFVGQPVLIVFLNTLASECEPEMPGLQAVYEKYQEEGLVVLGIGMGSSQSALRTYTGRFGGLSFPLLSDWEHTVGKAYSIETLPTNIFVRKNGKIWQVSSGAMTEAELDAVVGSVLRMP